MGAFSESSFSCFRPRSAVRPNDPDTPVHPSRPWPRGNMSPMSLFKSGQLTQRDGRREAGGHCGGGFIRSERGVDLLKAALCFPQGTPGIFWSICPMTTIQPLMSLAFLRRHYGGFGCLLIGRFLAFLPHENCPQADEDEQEDYHNQRIAFTVCRLGHDDRFDGGRFLPLLQSHRLFEVFM
jgi:hypothetical protein